MNAFDGVVTIIGVLMGSLSARVMDALVVITTGLSTSVAMGISGLWGAYLTESAERKRSLEEMENHTLTDLSQTRIGRASRVAVVVVALVDGLSPFLASLLVLSPTMFSIYVGGTIQAYHVSLGLALAILFTLGAYLGTISKTNLSRRCQDAIRGAVCYRLKLHTGRRWLESGTIQAMPGMYYSSG